MDGKDVVDRQRVGFECAAVHTCKKLRQLGDPLPNSCRPPRCKNTDQDSLVCRDGGVPVAGGQVKSCRTEQESRWKEENQTQVSASQT